MGLNDDRRLFYKIRSNCGIIVSKHAFEDYPERGFSEKEIIDLVRNGTGRLTVNKSPNAIEGSYLYLLKDGIGRDCQLVILIEIIEIEDEASTEGNQVIVCSAYRETKT